MIERITEHLNNLVSCYPVSSNQKSVYDLLDYCLLHLKQSGHFKQLDISENNGVFSLYGSTNGQATAKVMLQAHIDVVDAPERIRSLTQQDGKLLGRGVFDMLYATACYLTLIEDLAGSSHQLSLNILLTGDEELGGNHGTGNFVENGYGADIIFLPDAGHSLGDISVGAKGVHSFDLIVRGKSHHSSRPWEGDGAGNKLVLALNEILALSENTPDSPFTIVVSVLAGGDAHNKGPAEAAAHIDVRYVSSGALEQFQVALESILQKFDAEVGDITEAPAFNLDLSSELVKQFLEIYQKYCGDKLVFTKTHGSSDARFFAAKAMPVIMIRPLGGEAHGEGEWISAAELSRFYEILKEFTLKAAKI